ncbi:hypothetical protein ST37_11500 [Vibrio sp. qd031]|uniref:YqcC family protein n=1 Tax=Vibrio sp. qd031 TaxID=1603038 RepID=UPI000A108FD4|nr:YqcC family protein [Vibrio sp. qd031]ORT50479.1 hypothetical protein ST37_11500 [Vibrio sp. qd031]
MSVVFDTNRSRRLLQLFEELKSQLVLLDEWQQSPPSAERLASSQPFAVDTLSASEWLQWVFLPKMTQLIHSQQMLPSGFEITPYFEQVWQTQTQFRELLVILSHIDKECA